MADADYRPFHYTRIYQVWRSFQAACTCGWDGEHRKDAREAGADANTHLIEELARHDRARQEAPTEEIDVRPG